MSTRLFVSGAFGNDVELVLQGEQARYLGRVLRSRTGDEVRVFNGDVGEWSATIASISKSTVVLRVNSRCDPNTESLLDLHLVQGISRGDRMDFVVQKTTELGVTRITPVLTHHGVVKLDAQRGEKRRQHWQHIAESACEQSGRTQPPLIDAPIALNTWFGARNSAQTTELILQPGAAMALTAIDRPPEKLCLLIGPEGGFSEREIGDAAIAGFSAVAIGPRVLRTETAALAAVCIAQSQWGDIQA